jgi:alpha-ketoglutarate-dependent taurine dioxygenase
VLADRFFDYLATSPLVRSHIQAVKLAPGDAVTWKDRRVLHGRNGFLATQESERFLWKCAIDVGQFGED